jgi:ligand-binding SRPBCC domain-containing protein
MADYVLERRLWIPRPRPEVFGLFSRPENLPHLSPRRARLRWLSSPPERLAAGSVLDFSMRSAGLRFRWRLFVREFDPPYRFVSVQLRGPLARWEHVHRFVEEAGTEGRSPGPGTWVEDRVTYRVPLGALGELAHLLALRRYIVKVLDDQDRRVRSLLSRRDRM